MNDSLFGSTDTSDQQVQRRKARLTFMAILAVFILPFFMVPLFSSIDQVGKNNKGSLIQPHIPLADLRLEQIEGGAFGVENLHSRWTLLYIMPDDCDENCVLARNHALYAMRQVRLSMDRQMDRVQQLLVFTQTPDASLKELIQREFSTMLQASANRDELMVLRANQQEPAGRIFLMSPDGYIFMSYPTFIDENESVLRARDIRADLKKSLKGDRNF